MKKYLSIIRWPNLLMVPLTMYLMRYCIIQPMLDYQYSIQLGTQVTHQLSEGYFLILVLINVFLGAAGYVINDYFDRRIDSINRPESVVVDKILPRRIAIAYHFVLNIIALVLACVFACHLRMKMIFVLYLMIAGIFWLYSTSYKKQLFVGNIVVACGTATIPLQVGIFEYLTLTREYGFDMLVKGLSFMPIMYWMAGFAFFAFITNIIREIVKDMEDLEGDSNYGCNTLPLAYGIRSSKIVVVALTLFTIAALALTYFIFFRETLTLLYMLIFIIMPLILTIILTIRANEVKQYHRISNIIKVIMLFGILYSVLAKQIMEFVV